MALPAVPDGLKAVVDVDGVVVTLRGHRLRITEWAITIEERGLFSSDRIVIPLGELVGVRLGHAVMDENRWALVIKTKEESHLIGAGMARVRLGWVLDAIQEAERTRARREGVDGREYLFEKVVPDEVRDLIER